jgi:hypothetical protein
MGGNDPMRSKLASYLTRLDLVLDRLAKDATQSLSGRTAPDATTGERWEAGQVWAHLAEFGSYWLGELEQVVAGGTGVVFGRTKADAQRIAAIEAHRHRPQGEQFTVVQTDVRRLGAYLTQLDDRALQSAGLHPTLGEMDVWAILEEFLVGHYEQHADQLDSLRPVPA